MALVELTKKHKLLMSNKNASNKDTEEFDVLCRKELGKINNKIMMCVEMFNSLMAEIA